MKQRESNFEMLRIIAMMMVLLHCNYFVLGDVNATEIGYSPFVSLAHGKSFQGDDVPSVLLVSNLITYSFSALIITMLFGVTCMCLDKIRIYIWNKISIFIQ